MPEAAIKSAEESDLKRIAGFALDSSKKYDFPGTPDDEASLRKAFSMGPDFVWLAESKGNVVAYLFSRPSPREDGSVLIDTLFVHPDFRRKGIGTQMVKSFLESRKERVFVEAPRQFPGAKGFYEKFGFDTFCWIMTNR